MYQALYRKWRPTVFGDVYGQPHITSTLRREVASGRVGHAYLFTGTRGTGKTTCAKILAKAVNCIKPHDGNPCNECENCRGIQDGSIFDVTEIDAASNNGVDNIRDLRDETVFTPAKAKKKVYIIDEVHMLSAGAFNALLKTLEEPPEHVIFILATTEAHKLPATILSRCQRFDFRRISPAAIAARLTEVAQKEGIDCDGDALSYIARLADGALRDALSILDQCASQGERVTRALVMRLVGATDREPLERLSRAVAAGDASSVIEQVAQLYAGSKDMSLLCSELMAHYRDIMAVKLSNDPKSLLALTDDQCESLRAIANEYTLESLLYCVRALADTLSRMSRYADKRAELELCLIRLCSPSLDDSREALLARIKRLEELAQSGGGLTASKADTGGSPPAKKPAEPRQKGGDSRETCDARDGANGAGVPETPGDDCESGACEKGGEDCAAQSGDAPFWDEMLAHLRSQRLPQLCAFLRLCKGRLEGSTLVIECPDEVSCQFLGAKENAAHITEAARAVAGTEYRLAVRRGQGAAPGEKDARPELRFDDGGAGIVEYI